MMLSGAIGMELMRRSGRFEYAQLFTIEYASMFLDFFGFFVLITVGVLIFLILLGGHVEIAVWFARGRYEHVLAVGFGFLIVAGMAGWLVVTRGFGSSLIPVFVLILEVNRRFWVREYPKHYPYRKKKHG